MKTDALIKIDNVWKKYDMGEAEPLIVLREISLEIRRGEFVAITGPSGSGKSTMLNLVGVLDKPSYGEVYLDGQDISSMTESRLAVLRGKIIGFIFQQFNLIPNLTAKENVLLPMLFQETTEEEREQRSEDLLKLVGLEDRMEHYPGQLSGGQQQRVAIARALANDPEVILADEPTGNLDTKTGEKVMKFLNELNEKGKTIILVTHSPELAHEHAKAIYWLKDGRIEKVTKKVGRKWVEVRAKKGYVRY